MSLWYIPLPNTYILSPFMVIKEKSKVDKKMYLKQKIFTDIFDQNLDKTKTKLMMFNDFKHFAMDDIFEYLMGF